MILEENLYGGCCDNCGQISQEYKISKDELISYLQEEGWFIESEKNEIIYCPNCYSYNEDTDQLKIYKNE